MIINKAELPQPPCRPRAAAVYLFAVSVTCSIIGAFMHTLYFLMKSCPVFTRNRFLSFTCILSAIQTSQFPETIRLIETLPAHSADSVSVTYLVNWIYSSEDQTRTEIPPSHSNVCKDLGLSSGTNQVQDGSTCQVRRALNSTWC